MGLLATLESLTDTLRQVLGDFDPDALGSEDAAALVGAFDQVMRLAGAGRLLATTAVTACGSWSDAGRHDSAGRWLADLSGRPVKDAERLLSQAQALRDLPRVEEALRHGELSEAQVQVVTEAARDDPRSQDELLEAARSSNFGELRARGAAVRNRARSKEDDEARHTRQHRPRRCSLSTDEEGMGVLVAKVAPGAFGELRSALEHATDQVFAAARARGEREPRAAYRADALVQLVTGAQGTSGRRPRVLIRIDAGALRRGSVEAGEVCDLPGVGPLPVAAVRDLVGEALLSVILTEGQAVVGLANPRRRPAVALELALMWRDPHCVVPGCGASSGLETDHFPVQVADPGPTSLDNLVRICRRHHHQRHRHGYVLSGGPGHWSWDPPPAFEDSLDLELGGKPSRAGPASSSDPAAPGASTPATPTRAAVPDVAPGPADSAGATQAQSPTPAPAAAGPRPWRLFG